MHDEHVTGFKGRTLLRHLYRTYAKALLTLKRALNTVQPDAQRVFPGIGPEELRQLEAKAKRKAQKTISLKTLEKLKLKADFKRKRLRYALSTDYLPSCLSPLSIGNAGLPTDEQTGGYVIGRDQYVDFLQWDIRDLCKEIATLSLSVDPSGSIPVPWSRARRIQELKMNTW